MGLENVPCKERLGELALLGLKERRFWGCLAAPFQCIKGDYQMREPRSLWSCMAIKKKKKRGNGTKLNQGWF